MLDKTDLIELQVITKLYIAHAETEVLFWSTAAANSRGNHDAFAREHVSYWRARIAVANALLEKLDSVPSDQHPLI